MEEAECEMTCSQLDSTISTISSISQPIVINPHPLILRDQKKMEILRKWEKKFKTGGMGDSRLCTVKLETNVADLNKNLTHFIVESFDDWDVIVNYNGCYTTSYYEALLMGSWIVSFDWIKSCLKEGEITDEEQYVVSFLYTTSVQP